MPRLSRLIFAGILVVGGLTACGRDKITVSGPLTKPITALTVHAVTVMPAVVNLAVGDTVTLVAMVDADAGLARTVTWTSKTPSVATVAANGLVTAVASGTAMIVATSTSDTTVSAGGTVNVASTN